MSDRPINGHPNPAGVEHLLGGYATNTLTEAERSALFEAALTDQRLFDALADEDALRELLADEDSRRQLLASIKPAPSVPAQGWWVALLRPRTLVLASSMAVALLIAVMIRPVAQQPPHIDHARSTAGAAGPVKQKAGLPRVAADKPAASAGAYAVAEGAGKKVPPAPPPAVIKEEVAASFGAEARQEKPAEARDGERELAKVGQVAPAPATPAGGPLKDQSARADEAAAPLAGNRGRAAVVEQDRQNAAAPNKSSNQMAQTLGAAQDVRAQAAFRRIAGGAIVAVDSDTVTINAGRDQSLVPRDILEVRRGAVLLGEIELTEVEGSSAKAKLRGAFAPKPGDAVSRKPPQ